MADIDRIYIFLGQGTPSSPSLLCQPIHIQVNTAYVVGKCYHMGRERFSYGLCVEGKEDLHRELYGEKHNSEILAFFKSAHDCLNLKP